VIIWVLNLGLQVVALARKKMIEEIYEMKEML
jgi:hypothetical protein